MFKGGKFIFNLGQGHRRFSSFSRENKRILPKGFKISLTISACAYLYFQEDLTSQLIKNIHQQYLHFDNTVKENKQYIENKKHAQKLYDSFDPLLMIEHFQKKLEQELGKPLPFNDNLTSDFICEKVEALKADLSQVIYNQKGMESTLEALEIAREWKRDDGPVLYFNSHHYEEGDASGLLGKYGFGNLGLLKKSVRQLNSQKPERFEIWRVLSNCGISPALFQYEVQEPIISSKYLLIIIDEADTLFKDMHDDNGKNNPILAQIKSLMKENVARVLFLCEKQETKATIKREFGAVVNPTVPQHGMGSRSKQNIQNYLKYVSNVANLEPKEAKQFFTNFGVNFFALLELKNSLADARLTQNSTESFDAMKVKNFA